MIDRNELLQEFKLRKFIRKAIKLSERKRKQKIDNIVLEEQKLRQVIRKLLSEGTPTADNDPAPHSNTGINVLEDLLKKIIPVVETDFKKLTTSADQRKSFRSHMVRAVEDALAPQRATVHAPNDPKSKMLSVGESDLGEEIDIEVGGEEDKFIDIEPEKEKEEEPADPRDDFGIEGEDLTGRNVAFDTFKKVGQNILDAYDVLGSDEDRDVFYDYLITNLKLYFDKFENDMGVVVEPTTDEYEAEAGSEEQGLKL